LPALPPKQPATATATATAEEEGQKKACFAAGTPLRTPGGWRNIEELGVGDLVLSRDQFDPSGDVLPKVVEEVFVTEGLVWHLHTCGQVIRTTAEHPFYVRERGWVPCNQLQIGDWLITEDGLCVRVDDLLDTGAYETLYNLRIADFHTYFVGCQDWGFSVWAHNKCWYHGTDSANAALIIANGLNEQGFANANPNDVRGVFVETNSDTAGDYARLVTFERNKVRPKGTPKLTPVILVADSKDIGKYLEPVPGAIEGEKYIPVKNFPLVPKTAFNSPPYRHLCSGSLNADDAACAWRLVQRALESTATEPPSSRGALHTGFIVPVSNQPENNPVNAYYYYSDVDKRNSTRFYVE
jgi:hypothetical protein